MGRSPYLRRLKFQQATLPSAAGWPHADVGLPQGAVSYTRTLEHSTGMQHSSSSSYGAAARGKEGQSSLCSCALLSAIGCPACHCVSE